MKESLSTRVRFGPFELDLKAGELRTGSRTILLQEQPFRVLQIIVERGGELATRQEIQKKLWPNDTVVEFDHGINTAIKKIRQALDDSANDPTFIETVARRGYRLLVPVEPVDISREDPSEQKTSDDEAQKPAQRTLGAGELTGKKVSHYRVLEILGGGGMGIVFKAEDLKLGRRVALKFLPEELADDQRAWGRFEREARAASASNHPNICTIYEIAEHEGQPFIVMELLEGETLRDLISKPSQPADNQKGPGIPLVRLLGFSIQVAMGLEAAHLKGIIHRDIKPANIFVTTHDQVKILDFGLAKLLDAGDKDGDAQQEDASTKHEAPFVYSTLTRTGLAQGTAGYMSPEQLRGEKLDARSDVFSFGLVLYEMATGERAFRGETVDAIQEAILHSNPVPVCELNPALPPRLQEIIDRALKKDVNQRFQSALEMGSELESLATHLSAATNVAESRTPPNGLTADATSDRRKIDPSSELYVPIRSRFSRFGLTRSVLIAFLIIFAAAAVWFVRSRVSQAGSRSDITHNVATNVRTIPLTTLRGMVNDIAFSPDDRQIAFTWEGPGLGKRNVYVELIGGDRPVQITDTKRGTISGVDWSPDGRLISFGRCGDDNRGALYTIPIAGGLEQKLTDVACTYGIVEGVWTPDGRSLVFADDCAPGGPMGIVVFTLATGTRRCLVRAESNDIRLYYPGVSPDGRTVTYERASSLGVQDIYSIPIEGGTPLRVTYEKDGCCAVFTKDGKYMVFSSARTGTSKRWRVPAQGGTVEPEVNTLYAHDGTLSRDGRRLAYWEYSGPGSAIWRVQVSGPGGRVLSQRKILELKGGLNESQQLSPDGKQIAFAAAASGTGNIWKSDADGSNPLQLTSFGGALTGSPRWSPDGKWIAFDHRDGDHAQIYVIDAEGKNHRAITNGSYENNVPSWSRDGKSIYFSSNRTGQWALWKKDLGSGVESQVTRHGGFSGFESYDGRDLYYTKFYSSGIWRMPVEGGEEQRITDGPENWYWGAWAITRAGLYYMDVDASPRPAINYYDFRTRRTKSVFQPGGQTLPHEVSLNASIDGRILLVAQHDQSSTIIIAENFQ